MGVTELDAVDLAPLDFTSECLLTSAESPQCTTELTPSLAPTRSLVGERVERGWRHLRRELNRGGSESHVAEHVFPVSLQLM